MTKLQSGLARQVGGMMLLCFKSPLGRRRLFPVMSVGRLVQQRVSSGIIQIGYLCRCLPETISLSRIHAIFNTQSFLALSKEPDY